MSQTVITKAFTQWKAAQAVNNQPVVLDEFIFANVPDLDLDLPVSDTEAVPAAGDIVHRQAVSKTGVVNDNSVVYSITLGADVGDFDFNWIGLGNKATGTLAMIIHAPEQRKIKNASGQQGNVLVRSMLMEYSGAQTATNITTPAETWQIDFTARLAGMDEAVRLAALDIYGQAAFFDNGFLVAKTGTQHFVTKGLGYVAGLRASLAENQNITVSAKPTKVWADVCYHGTLTSAYQTDVKFTVAPELADYSLNGVAHFVFALASIDVNGIITDLRPKGTLDNQEGNNTFLRKDASLSDLTDPAAARNNLDLGTAATSDVQTSRTDSTPGRVLTVGAYGLGNGTYISTNEDKIALANRNPVGWGVMRAHGASDAPSGSYLQIMQMADTAAVNAQRSLLALDAASNGWFGAINSSGVVKWSKVYTDTNKPRASDVGAVAKTGDTMTGILTINYDNGALALKAKTTNSSLYIFAADADNSSLWYIGKGSNGSYDALFTNYKGGNNNIALRADGSINIALTHGKSLTVNGQVVPSSYSNFDGRYPLKDGANYIGFVSGNAAAPYMRHASSNTVVRLATTTYAYTKAESDGRYVQNIKRGAQTSPAKTSQYGANAAPAGCVLTRAWGDPSDHYGVLMTYCPLLMYVKGAWRTIAE